MLLVFSGCARVNHPLPSPTVVDNPIPEPAVEVPVEVPAPAPAIETAPPVDELGKLQGIVFGKTIFSGVLKADYVKLSMTKLEDESVKFYLIIGDKLGPALLPWNSKSVEPGYFFLEMPAGGYRIDAISIPVGSTLATEETDLFFYVTPNGVTYIGTLAVVGTGEKVKFGGLPLLVPGFDYQIDIWDERAEANRQFHIKYPLVNKPIEVRLLQDRGASALLNPSISP